MTCKDWLRANGYEDVVDLIDQAIAKMAARGSNSDGTGGISSPVEKMANPVCASESSSCSASRSSAPGQAGIAERNQPKQKRAAACRSYHSPLD